MADHKCTGAFLEALPVIQSAAAVQLRVIRGAEYRAELQGEVIALAWCEWIRVDASGRDPGADPRTFASYLAKNVLAGRTAAEGRRGLGFERRYRKANKSRAKVNLDTLDTGSGRTHGGALACAQGANPSELATARLDWAAFLATLNRADRRLLKQRAQGRTNAEIGQLCGAALATINARLFRLRNAYKLFQRQANAL